MYFYFYDAFLSERRFAKNLAEIETRLTDLGLEGRTGRLVLFRNAKDMLREAVRRGAKTIVAVGNDETVRRVVEVYPDFSIPLGIIPLSTPTAMADFLGIPYGVAACDVLSARIVQDIDIGQINDKYFLTSVEFPHAENVTLACEGKYAVKTTGRGDIEICNLLSFNRAREYACNPRDGVFDAFVSGAKSSVFGNVRRVFGRGAQAQSVFPLRHIEVKSASPVTAIYDGGKMEESNFVIEMAREKLRVITGRGRKF